MRRTRHIWVYVGITVVLAVLVAAELLQGPGAADARVIRMLRLPRVVTAVCAGAALALAGAQMQSVLRNPLADPHIMGVSSGAALGAAVATMWTAGGSKMATVAAGGSKMAATGTMWAGSGGAAGALQGAAQGALQGTLQSALQGVSVAAAAFIGAALTAVIILAVSRKFRSASTLLIFGVMLGFIVNAITAILQVSSDAESLKIFYSWSAGSFSTSTWPQIAVMAAMLVIGFIIAYRGRKGLDIILFGDEYARMAGAGVEGIRIRALLSGCILTAAVTAFCGPLGFVGIVAPHTARALCGTSAHKSVLPASLLTGCVISLAADLISQLSPTPLPTASTMAIVGIPIILYILIRKPAI